MGLSGSTNAGANIAGGATAGSAALLIAGDVRRSSYRAQSGRMHMGSSTSMVTSPIEISRTQSQSPQYQFLNDDTEMDQLNEGMEESKSESLQSDT